MSHAISNSIPIVMTHGSGLTSILLDCMMPCRDDIEQTEGTLVSVHFWITRCYCLMHAIGTPISNCNCLHTHHILILIVCYSNTLQWQWCTALLWLWFAWMYGLSCRFWTNRKYVGIGTCFNLEQCSTAWCSILLTIAHSCDSTTIMVKKYGPALILILVEYMHGTFLYWNWTNRAYVGIVVAC